LAFLFLLQAGNNWAGLFWFGASFRSFCRCVLLLFFIPVIFALNISFASSLLPIDNQSLWVFLSSLNIGFLLLLKFLTGKEFLLLSWSHFHDVLFGLILLNNSALCVEEFNSCSFIELSLTDLFTKLL
jgi:hypothetical protein